MRRGLFYPELTLGVEAISYNRRLELQEFFVELVRRRAFPLHVASLWNALYFGYDLEAGGYSVETIEPKRIPIREMATRDWSLPIGGFIRVRTETRAGDLLAEVVYKEGAHPAVTADFLDPVLSGAPAANVEITGKGMVAVVRERFVLDLGAFGADSNSIDATQYERLLRRARWLDAQGHLIIDAIYKPEDAELDDLDYYVNYLLEQHREGLLAFAFRDEPSGEELREGLVRSLEAVAEIASSCQEIRAWRAKYFFSEEAYKERISNQEPDPVLGREDLYHLFRGLTRVPSGTRVAYSAIGPRILELLAAGGLHAEEKALVRGTAYATAIVFTNAHVTDTLSTRAAQGVLEGGVHLRLDDDWQAGGIWRAEHGAPASLALVPPDVPLHLGFAESQPVQFPVDLEAEPLPVTMRSFRVGLTRRDLSLGILRLPSQVEIVVGEVDVVVRHTDERHAHHGSRSGSLVEGIAWPLSFYPGIICHCNAESGGGRILVRTTPLAQPIVVGTTELLFETNIELHERETRAEPLRTTERQGGSTLRELIHRAFRSRGLERPDGSRVLYLAQVVAILFGPGWRNVELQAAATELAGMELEREGELYLWRPAVTPRTRVTDRTLLMAYGDAKPERRLPRIVHRHWVPMHLRRLASWQHSASTDKVLGYPEARHRYGMYGLIPGDLPSGYTWVEPHERGSDEPNA